MKEYIMDDGRVRACDSNIAKMNVIEYMWHMRYRLCGNICETIGEFIDNLYIIGNLGLIAILPIYYPYMAIMHIRSAKKAVREWEAAKEDDT